MIESIKIQNFLSIRKELTLSFVATREKDRLAGKGEWTEKHGGRKLSKMLFLFGNNAAGKTNIITAIRTIRNIVLNVPQRRDSPMDFMPFLLDATSRKQPTRFTITYFIGEERYQYCISYNNKVIIGETLILVTGTKHNVIFDRTYEPDSDVTKIEYGRVCDMSNEDKQALIKSTKVNGSVLATFWDNNMRSDLLRSNLLFFKDKIAFDMREGESLADILSSGTKAEQERLKHIIVMFLRLIGSNINDYEIRVQPRYVPKEILEHMKQLNPSLEIEDILKKEYVPYKTLTFYHKTNKGQFPIEEDLESDGTLQLIQLIAMGQYIIDNDITVFLDEECDRLHEIALKYLVLCYIQLSHRCQLVLAGQDTSFLENKSFRRDSIRVIRKDEEGNSYIVEPSRELYQRNINLQNYIYQLSGLYDDLYSKTIYPELSTFIDFVLKKMR